MTVSPRTEAKLRQAMERLLAGTPVHSDGALTKENLAREAEVSHATVHRATDILAEWDALVPKPRRRTPTTEQDDLVADLRRQLREAKARLTELQGQYDALGTVTANLYHENLVLKRKLGDHSIVTPLPRPGERRWPAHWT